MPRRFRLADLPAAPWKNGGGTTREILCWPPGAGAEAFDWRVSVATIAQAGPFSAFPGVARSITLLAGAGVHLRGAGIDHRLDTRWEPFAFSGDVPLACALLGDGTPSTDFNVMARRAAGHASVHLLRAAADLDPAAPPAIEPAIEPALQPARFGLLLALAGDWRIGEAGTGSHLLAEGEGLWWADAPPPWDAHYARAVPHAAPGAFSATPAADAPGCLAWVRWQPHADSA